LQSDLRRDPRLEALRNAEAGSLLAGAKAPLRGPRSYAVGPRRPRGVCNRQQAVEQAEESKRLWQEHMEQSRQRAAEDAAEELRQAVDKLQQSAVRWRTAAAARSEEAAFAQQQAAAAQFQAEEAEERNAVSEKEVARWQQLAKDARSALDVARVEVSSKLSEANMQVLREKQHIDHSEQAVSMWQERAEAAQHALTEEAERSKLAARERGKAANRMHAAETRIRKAQASAELNEGAVADWQELAGAAQAALEAAWSEASSADKQSSKFQREAAKSVLAAEARALQAEARAASLEAEVAHWQEEAKAAQISHDSVEHEATGSLHTSAGWQSFARGCVRDDWPS